MFLDGRKITENNVKEYYFTKSTVIFMQKDIFFFILLVYQLFIHFNKKPLKLNWIEKSTTIPWNEMMLTSHWLIGHVL